MRAPERPRIEPLPPAVAARIAAGEVIERPASVVKELVENALDAGAGRIEVEVEAGGVERLRVRDDGCGIPADQVAAAFARHATSKLRSERDLFAVRTLGFRGEALAAIAAAADVELTTRPPGAEAAAVARVRDGRLAPTAAAAAAPGTMVEARDLFASLPARLKFLRGPRAETRAVAQVVADYALAYPDVAFRLVADGRELLRSPGSGDPLEAVVAVHGAEVAALLVPAHAVREAATADGEPAEGDGAAATAEPGARVEVHGLVGLPALHRASRGGIHLFAGGRAIGSRALVHAIEQAYAGLIPAGRHPVAVLHVRVPPEQVDVNVHPRKAEVRFRHERLVYGAMGAAVAEALAGTARSAPWSGAARAGAGGFAAGGAWGADGAGGPTARRGHAVLASARAAGLLPHGADGDIGGGAGEAAVGGAEARGRRETLGAGAGAREALGPLRAVGQVGLTYLVAEGPRGLVLVDQHAAHERVLYEQVTAARAAGTPATQPLLEPAVADLSAPQSALAEAAAEALAALGWALEPADGRAWLVRAVPSALAGRDAASALRDYLDGLEAEERLTGPDRAAAALACRAAVVAGDRLEGAQQRALLRALEAAATPHACPHGRPTTLAIDAEALARAFGRR